MWGLPKFVAVGAVSQEGHLRRVLLVPPKFVVKEGFLLRGPLVAPMVVAQLEEGHLRQVLLAPPKFVVQEERQQQGPMVDPTFVVEEDRLLQGLFAVPTFVAVLEEEHPRWLLVVECPRRFVVVVAELLQRGLPPVPTFVSVLVVLPTYFAGPDLARLGLLNRKTWIVGTVLMTVAQVGVARAESPPLEEKIKTLHPLR